jgi:hypothetical protein
MEIIEKLLNSINGMTETENGILPEQEDVSKSQAFFSINPTNQFNPLTVATFIFAI